MTNKQLLVRIGIITIVVILAIGGFLLSYNHFNNDAVIEIHNIVDTVLYDTLGIDTTTVIKDTTELRDSL